MSHNITVEAGASVRLPTAGKYCDRDIVVTATGGSGGAGDGSGGWDGQYTQDGRINQITVGNFAFYNSDYIKLVTLANCGSVGSFAFYGCSNLKTVNVHGDNILTVYEHAFANCQSLETASLGDISDVPVGCFQDCENLISVSLTRLDVGGNVCNIHKIDNYAFDNCVKLTEIKGDGTADAIGCENVYPCAFTGCSSLKKIHFYGCEHIYNEAFSGCTNLTTLILRGNSICEIALNAFINTPMLTGEGHIYISSSMYESYRTAYEAVINELMPGFFDILFRKIEDYPEICG